MYEIHQQAVFFSSFLKFHWLKTRRTILVKHLLTILWWSSCKTSYLAPPNFTLFSNESKRYCSRPLCIQLFGERLSEKVHATIPKGVVGGWFWVHCSSKKFKRLAIEAMDLCLRGLKESNKSRFDSYSVRNSVLIISHITFRDCRAHIFSDNLSRNKRKGPFFSDLRCVKEHFNLCNFIISL